MTRRSDAEGADVHAALSSPTRRRLLQLLRADGAARDAHDLAEVVELHLTTVRFHLEALRRAGLLVRSSSSPAGAGRPRTVYAAVAVGGDVVDGYRQLASLLAAHLSDIAEARATRAEQAGRSWAGQLVPTAGDTDLTVDEAAGQVTGLFADLGFEPELASVGADRQIALRACPFRAVAREHPEVVCSIHLGLLRGSLVQLGVSAASRLVPFVEPELCVAHLTAA